MKDQSGKTERFTTLNLKSLLVVSFLLTIHSSVIWGAETKPTTPISQLVRTGQISTYGASGEMVEFKGSGQDGEQQRGVVWPEPRFSVNDDGTVTDRLTGLMWLKNSGCLGKLPWSSAVKRIDEFNQRKRGECVDYSGLYDDWDVPDLNQLATLINAEQAFPSDFLKLQGFSNVKGELYWSSTAYLNYLNAWGVDFGNGLIHFQNKLKPSLVMPVRVSGPRRAYAKVSRQGALEASPRFVENGDGTVTDSSTGLMWLVDAACFSDRDWLSSLKAIAELNKRADSSQCRDYNNTYSDWSLPNRVELRSIIDYGMDYPATELRAVLDQHVAVYWTSTSLASAPDRAYTLSAYTGELSAAPKGSHLTLLAVRSAVPHPLAPRKESVKVAGLEVKDEYVLTLAPELHSEIKWPPAPRFFDNGDGTIMDAITGVNWLADAGCLGKQSWKEAFKVINKFNSDPRDFECKNYYSSFGDWQLPSIENMLEIMNLQAKNNVEWLTSQGAVNVQGGGDYWSTSETPVNLYYAKVINFKSNVTRNYPKSLKFFIWPQRHLPQDFERVPLLDLTINANNQVVNLTQDDPVSAAVFVHTFGLRFPADFWFWYDTPGGEKLWLTPIRTWTDKMTPVYQGNIFNLKRYLVYESLANKLTPGNYVFHFAVDSEPNGTLDNLRYEVKVTVVIKEDLGIMGPEMAPTDSAADQ